MYVCPLLSSFVPFSSQNFYISSYNASFTLMGSWIKVEGLSFRSPEEGHKSCSREKAVETRTKKRRAKQKKERGRGRWKCASFVRVRFIGVASRSEAPRKRLLREKATPSSTIHINRYRTYSIIYICTYKTQDTHTHIHTHMCIARAREEPSLFLGTSQRTSSRSLPPPPARCDLPDLIRHCHANSATGISLIRRALRSHMCTCARRIYISFFTSHLPPFAAPIKLISSYVDHFRDRCAHGLSSIIASPWILRNFASFYIKIR